DPRPAADLEGGLAYHHQGQQITTDISGRSLIRHMDDSVMPLRQDVKFDLAAVGQRQQLRLTQRASYIPSYQFGGISSSVSSPEIDAARAHGDLANSDLSAVELNSSVDWNWTLGRRSALAASYILRRTTFDGSPELDMLTEEIGGMLTRRI